MIDWSKAVGLPYLFGPITVTLPSDSPIEVGHFVPIPCKLKQKGCEGYCLECNRCKVGQEVYGYMVVGEEDDFSL